MPTKYSEPDRDSLEMSSRCCIPNWVVRRSTGNDGRNITILFTYAGNHRRWLCYYLTIIMTWTRVSSRKFQIAQVVVGRERGPMQSWGTLEQCVTASPSQCSREGRDESDDRYR